MVFERTEHFHACQLATSNSVKQHKLRKLIACLSEKKANGKELISLYIPHKITIDEVVAFLKNELGSSPTKSQSDSAVRGRLENTLKNVIQHLKLQKGIPDNGIAFFAGTFAATDFETEGFSIEELIPPEPIITYFYEVDNHFRLEPLREMLRNQNVVGIVSLDSKEASFGVLNGERLEIIENITSGIHGQSGKGGSSQRRYERERDMQLTYYFHRVAEHAAKAFLENHKVTVLIIGGPGQTKEDFLKGDFLHYELKNAVLSVVDTQFVGKEGLSEALEKSAEIRQNMCAPEEKRIMLRLLAEVGKQNGLAIYGLDSVLKGLEKGEVEVALITDNTDMIEIDVVCKKCQLSRRKIVKTENKVQFTQEIISKPCPRCNAVEYVVNEKDIVDVLEDVASKTNASIEVISTESSEKAKLTALSGFAALLRYRPKEG